MHGRGIAVNAIDQERPVSVHAMVDVMLVVRQVSTALCVGEELLDGARSGARRGRKDGHRHDPMDRMLGSVGDDVAVGPDDADDLESAD